MLLPFKNCPMNVPYKVSWILFLTEVLSISTLRIRIISEIMNIYWSHAIALQKLSNERSYKFSWILTLTDDISIWNLRFFDRQRKWRPLITPWLNGTEPKRQKKKIIRDDEYAFQYSRLLVIY